MTAPIVVFAYNRPEHLKKVLFSLSENNKAKKSDLFVFIDGPKNKNDIVISDQVYQVADSFSVSYFNNMNIVRSPCNRGLAQSIITGIDFVLKRYNKVIVLEDDSVCSNSFLDFMNGALDYYETANDIWSIGAYVPPIKLPEEYDFDIIKTQRVSSCAWGIWRDRWFSIDWNVDNYKFFRWNIVGRKEFNAWGNDRSSMLDDQMVGLIDSWAIRFDYAMFKHNSFNIIPRKSLIYNIGADGSGTNNGDIKNTEVLKDVSSFKFFDIKIDKMLQESFCSSYYTRRSQLAKRFIGNTLRYYMKLFSHK